MLWVLPQKAFKTLTQLKCKILLSAAVLDIDFILFYFFGETRVTNCFSVFSIPFLLVGSMWRFVLYPGVLFTGAWVLSVSDFSQGLWVTWCYVDLTYLLIQTMQRMLDLFALKFRNSVTSKLWKPSIFNVTYPISALCLILPISIIKPCTYSTTV